MKRVTVYQGQIRTFLGSNLHQYPAKGKDVVQFFYGHAKAGHSHHRPRIAHIEGVHLV